MQRRTALVERIPARLDVAIELSQHGHQGLGGRSQAGMVQGTVEDRLRAEARGFFARLSVAAGDDDCWNGAVGGAQRLEQAHRPRRTARRIEDDELHRVADEAPSRTWITDTPVPEADSPDLVTGSSQGKRGGRAGLRVVGHEQYRGAGRYTGEMVGPDIRELDRRSPGHVRPPFIVAARHDGTSDGARGRSH